MLVRRGLSQFSDSNRTKALRYYLYNSLCPDIDDIGNINDNIIILIFRRYILEKMADARTLRDARVYIL